jgi:hypothetical protein
MKYNANFLPILRKILSIKILLFIFLTPACIPFAMGMIAGVEQNKVEVMEKIKASKKVDYIGIAKNIGRMEGYDIGPGGPLQWGNMVGLIKKKFPEYIEIIVSKRRDRDEAFISVMYANREKFTKQEAHDRAVKILNDFKEKYLSEIDKAKEIN